MKDMIYRRNMLLGGGLTPKPFATCTDQELIKAVEAHYAGKINLADYWALGDKRTVSLSAMAKRQGTSALAPAQDAQTVEIMIIGFDFDTLATSVNGHTKAAVSCHLADCLSTKGRQSSAAGWAYGDGNRNPPELRVWCNNEFKSAFPAYLKNNMKRITFADTYMDTAATDYCFLPDVRRLKKQSATNISDIYPFYRNSSDPSSPINCIKHQGYGSNTAITWWLCTRTPSGYFYYVDYKGSVSAAVYSNDYGICPVFCL